MTVISEPTTPHRCAPPRYRPKSEWRTVPVPRAWSKQDGAKFLVPTAYEPGTLWLCGCGRTWLRRPGQHVGRNPNFGHREGGWVPLPWWKRKERRAVEAYKADAAYALDAEIVAGWSKPPRELS